MSHPDRRQLLAGGLALGGALALPAQARARNFFRRHGLPIGVQLYTVGESARTDLPGTLNRLATIGYRTVEFACLHGHTPQQLRAAADAAGLRIASIHLNDTLIGSTDEDSNRIAADLAVLGTRDVVLPMFLFPHEVQQLPGESFPTYVLRGVQQFGPDLWKRTAALLNARGASLRREGLRLAYHNHNVEFAPVGGTTGWDIIERETDPALIDFEIDVGWVAAAGLDPVAFVARHAGRVRQMHVKDIRATTRPNFAFAQDPAEVGSGTIDWKRLLPTAYTAGVRQFYVEQEPPFAIDGFAALTKSFAFLCA